MSWALYDYLDAGGKNDFEAWCRTLQKGDLGKLNAKLKMLEDHGLGLLPQILAGPLRGYPHIYKLKINGRVALRPLLCKGHIDNDSEFTLLKGAFEVGGEWDPRTAPSEAVTRRDEGLADATRRCPHVKVL